MLKKVLSVVLALVLALGVCVVAASAATATQLQNALNQLPSDYNAQFYNDDTTALILEAKAAAAEALSSGTGINAAYALCDEAIEAINAGDFVWVDELYTDVWVFDNRDESKAVADIYFDIDADDYLMPGDTFDVTVSLKTNFYIRTMSLGFVYDKTKFEYVPDSITYPDATKAAIDTETSIFNANWGYYAGSGAEREDCFPATWTSDYKAQYGLLYKNFVANTNGADYFYPTEKTEMFTVTMKVKDEATLDETGRIYADEAICATVENCYLGSYTYPTIQFTRAYSANPNDMIVDMDDGKTRTANKAKDGTVIAGQTIIFHDADITATIGEEPANLDYTALEAAVANKDTLDETNYTEESWAAYAAAVEAGADELTDKTADTQEGIDAFTTEINNKFAALVPFTQESEITNITELTTPVVGSFVTLKVDVSKPAEKIQFVNEAGGTITYYPGYDRVVSVVVNDDGTQTWTIKMMVYKLSETYKVFPRFNKVWDAKYYRYILKDTHEYDGNIYSVAIPDAKDSRVYYGRHDVVVEAGLDVVKVQFEYLGTTATFTTSNATVVEKDGHNFWTVSFNFVKSGEGFKANINSRTSATGFEKSDVVMVADVLH